MFKDSYQLAYKDLKEEQLKWQQKSIKTDDFKAAKDWFDEKAEEGKRPELFEIEVTETKRKIYGFDYMYDDA